MNKYDALNVRSKFLDTNPKLGSPYLLFLNTSTNAHPFFVNFYKVEEVDTGRGTKKEKFYYFIHRKQGFSETVVYDRSSYGKEWFCLKMV